MKKQARVYFTRWSIVSINTLFPENPQTVDRLRTLC